MEQKKRPLSVTLFAIGLIILSLVPIKILFTPGYLEYYMLLFRPLPRETILLRYLVTRIHWIIPICLGLGLLARKEFFRKATLLFAVFTLLASYWETPLLTIDNNIQIMLAVMRVMPASYGIDMLPAAKAAAVTSFIAVHAARVVFSVWILRALTRPPVKEWFKA